METGAIWEILSIKSSKTIQKHRGIITEFTEIKSDVVGNPSDGFAQFPSQRRRLKDSFCSERPTSVDNQILRTLTEENQTLISIQIIH